MEGFSTDRLYAVLACVASFCDPRSRIWKVEAMKGSFCHTLSRYLWIQTHMVFSRFKSYSPGNRALNVEGVRACAQRQQALAVQALQTQNGKKSRTGACCNGGVFRFM
jgi:hypothetical protein